MNLILKFLDLPWTFAFFFLLFSLLLRGVVALCAGKHRRTAVLLAGSIFDILSFPLVSFHVLFPYLMAILTFVCGPLWTMDWASLSTADWEALLVYWPIVFDLIVLVYYLLLVALETKEAIKAVRGGIRARNAEYAFCPHCGAQQFNDLNSQCTNCGKDIGAPKAEASEEEDLSKLPTWKRVELARKKAADPEDPQSISCRFCGAPIQEHDLFCGQCGKRQS